MTVDYYGKFTHLRGLKKHIRLYHDGITPHGSTLIPNGKYSQASEDEVSFESSSAISSDEDESCQHEVEET